MPKTGKTRARGPAWQDGRRVDPETEFGRNFLIHTAIALCNGDTDAAGALVRKVDNGHDDAPELVIAAVRAYDAQAPVKPAKSELDAAQDVRNALMAALYERGATLQVVGDLAGISRERVRQILERAGVETRQRGKPGQPVCAEPEQETPASSPRPDGLNVTDCLPRPERVAGVCIVRKCGRPALPQRNFCADCRAVQVAESERQRAINAAQATAEEQ